MEKSANNYHSPLNQLSSQEPKETLQPKESDQQDTDNNEPDDKRDSGIEVAAVEGEEVQPAIRIRGIIQGTISGYAKGKITKTTTGNTKRLIQVDVQKDLKGSFDNSVFMKTVRKE